MPVFILPRPRSEVQFQTPLLKRLQSDTSAQYIKFETNIPKKMQEEKCQKETT